MRRHPEAAARHAGSAADDPDGTRRREAGVRVDDHSSCSRLPAAASFPRAEVPLVRFSAALLFTTVCLLLDRLRHRERHADRTLRAADGYADSLSDDRDIRVVRAGGGATGERSGGCRGSAGYLCGVAPERCMAAEPWSAHVGDIAALIATFIVCTALSAKVFRWE